MLILSLDYDADLYSQNSAKQSYKASKKGMQFLEELIRDYNIGITAFIQANAPKVELNKNFEICCHGLKHEDFTNLNFFEAESSIKKAIELISKKFNSKPLGFRAPYLKINKRILELLKKYFIYDSSFYAEKIQVHKNYKKDFFRVPITRCKKDFFKGYLISFFRGNRNFKFLEKLHKRRKVLHLAFHSWDLYWDKKFLSANKTKQRIKFLEKLFSNFEIYSIKDFLSEAINNKLPR